MRFFGAGVFCLPSRLVLRVWASNPYELHLLRKFGFSLRIMVLADIGLALLDLASELAEVLVELFQSLIQVLLVPFALGAPGSVEVRVSIRRRISGIVVLTY